MTTSTLSTRSLVIEKELPHPPEKIWRALTQGALIKEWLMDNDFQPVVGHKFNFRSTPMPNWDGDHRYPKSWSSNLTRSSPIAGARWGWRASSFGRWLPTKGGTLVRMEQSGFRPDQEAALQGRELRLAEVHRRLERVVAGLQ